MFGTAAKTTLQPHLTHMGKIATTFKFGLLGYFRAL